MNLKIENVTGSLDLIEYYYNIPIPGLISPLYSIEIININPIVIYVSIILLDNNNTVFSKIKLKSIHSFKNKIEGKLSNSEIEFLIKIAINNTSGKFIDFVFEDSNQQLLLQLPQADELLSSGKISLPWEMN